MAGGATMVKMKFQASGASHCGGQ